MNSHAHFKAMMLTTVRSKLSGGPDAPPELVGVANNDKGVAFLFTCPIVAQFQLGLLSKGSHHKFESTGHGYVVEMLIPPTTFDGNKETEGYRAKVLREVTAQAFSEIWNVELMGYLELHQSAVDYLCLKK